MRKLEESIRPFFWETDLEKIDLQQNKSYIIERVLELGNKTAVKWLLSTYSLTDIRRVLKESRNISKKSKIFWDMMLGDRKDV